MQWGREEKRGRRPAGGRLQSGVGGRQGASGPLFVTPDLQGREKGKEKKGGSRLAISGRLFKGKELFRGRSMDRGREGKGKNHRHPPAGRPPCNPPSFAGGEEGGTGGQAASTLPLQFGTKGTIVPSVRRRGGGEKRSLTMFYDATEKGEKLSLGCRGEEGKKKEKSRVTDTSYLPRQGLSGRNTTSSFSLPHWINPGRPGKKGRGRKGEKRGESGTRVGEVPVLLNTWSNATAASSELPSPSPGGRRRREKKKGKKREKKRDNELAGCLVFCLLRRRPRAGAKKRFSTIDAASGGGGRIGPTRSRTGM